MPLTSAAIETWSPAGDGCSAPHNLHRNTCSKFSSAENSKCQPSFSCLCLSSSAEKSLTLKRATYLEHEREGDWNIFSKIITCLRRAGAVAVCAAMLIYTCSHGDARDWEQDELFPFREELDNTAAHLEARLVWQKAADMTIFWHVCLMRAWGFCAGGGPDRKWKSGQSAHLKRTTIDTRPGRNILLKYQYLCQGVIWMMNEHSRAGKRWASSSSLSEHHCSLLITRTLSTALWKMLMPKIMVSLGINGWASS